MSLSSPLNGRMGNPQMDIQSDPRTHPSLAAGLQELGLGGNIPPPPKPGHDLAELEPVIAATHRMASMGYDRIPCKLPGDDDEAEIEEKTVSIDGPDNNKIDLYFFRRTGTSGPAPGVIYFHGGAMTIVNTINKLNKRWCKSLALEDIVVVAVDFRNAWKEGQHHAFPAGLNDCAAAVNHVFKHRTELGINKVVLEGESGGANLALATALKANREGWSHIIDGVYACAPYISGAYGWPEEKKRKELPSLIENDGYGASVGGWAPMMTWYTPKEADLTNPLAWPYHATEGDMRGLPPHALSLDELDPGRDEGVAYFRRLAAAGVPVTAVLNLGASHGACFLFRQALPELHKKVVGDIAAFAKRL